MPNHLNTEIAIINFYIHTILSKEKIDFIQKASKDCPVTRNLSDSLDIQINWHYQNY